MNNRTLLLIGILIAAFVSALVIVGLDDGSDDNVRTTTTTANHTQTTVTVTTDATGY